MKHERVIMTYKQRRMYADRNTCTCVGLVHVGTMYTHARVLDT